MDPTPNFTSIFGKNPPYAATDPKFETIATRFDSGLHRPQIGLTSTGVVTDLSSLDQRMLVFYTGHGTADGSPLDSPPSLTPALKLGQCTNGQDGKLRYLIVDSCNVLAHGPRCRTDDGSMDYGCPGLWKWDANGDNKDTVVMRNIFDRWGPALGNNLRMVCGASTLVSPDTGTLIAREYTPGVRSVADLIISRLAQDAVALCLALGGRDIATSTLTTDFAFTPTANNVGAENYYHLQYSKPFDDYKAISLTLPIRLTPPTSPIPPIGIIPQISPTLTIGLTPPVAQFMLDKSPSFPGCMPTLAVAAQDPVVASGSQKLEFTPARSEEDYLKGAKSEIDYIVSAWNILKEPRTGFFRPAGWRMISHTASA